MEWWGYVLIGVIVVCTLFPIVYRSSRRKNESSKRGSPGSGGRAHQSVIGKSIAFNPQKPFAVVTDDGVIEYDNNTEAKVERQRLLDAGEQVALYKNGQWRG